MYGRCRVWYDIYMVCSKVWIGGYIFFSVLSTGWAVHVKGFS